MLKLKFLYRQCVQILVYFFHLERFTALRTFPTGAVVRNPIVHFLALEAEDDLTFYAFVWINRYAVAEYAFENLEDFLVNFLLV